MRRWWSWLATAGAVAVAVGAVLPWVAIGPRRLDGFTLAAIARQFGLGRRAGLVGLTKAWRFVPLLSGLAAAAAMTGRHRLAAAAGALTGALGLAAAGTALRAAGGQCRFGVWVTFVAAGLALGGAPLVLRRPAGRPTRS